MGLLIGGAVTSIGFTFMFGAKDTWSRLLTAGSLAGLIGFAPYLIFTLAFPYSGTLAISPDALENLLRAWDPR